MVYIYSQNAILALKIQKKKKRKTKNVESWFLNFKNFTI